MARKMPRSLRKLVLTVHVVVSVGWIGIEAGLLALGLTGLYTHDPEVLRAAYVATGLFGGIFLVPVSIGTLRFQIVAAVSVALLLLITATTLSVYKPWGRRWFGRRKVVARREVKL